MRDRKALKAITNAIMKAHVDDPARQHVMDKAKAEQFAKAALKGLHKAGFDRYEAGRYGCVRSGMAAMRSNSVTRCLARPRRLNSIVRFYGWPNAQHLRFRHWQRRK